MIPKIAHWVWLYETPPEWVMDNISSFQKLHSDWEYHIWREPPSNFPSDLLSIMNGLPFYVSRSDIFRYWLMNEIGGIYLDCDNFAIRNFDKLLDVSFFTSPCMPHPHIVPQIACGLLGSEPKSEASEMILSEVRHRSDFKLRKTFGPDLMDAIFLNKSVPDEICKLYPSHYFYLWPNHQMAIDYCYADIDTRASLLNQQTLTDEEEPFSVHLWGMEGSSYRQLT